MALSGAAGTLHDIRSAIRRLRAAPGFSAVAIAIVALAVGANTAMFSVVNGVLLAPLPYPDAPRIVRVLERSPAGALNSISTLTYLDWAKQADVFEHLAAETSWQATLTSGDGPVAIPGARVSAAYFDIFGVIPARGRTFRPEDEQPGRDRVVVIAHAFWRDVLGSDPQALDRTLVLNGDAHTIVGVLPADGPFDRAAARIWKPLAFQPANLTRDYRWLAVTARLKPGVTLAQAGATMNVVADRLAAEHPASNRGWGAAVERLSDVIISPGLRTAVTTLFAATLFVLLIGGANLAALMLARTVARDGELAVRAALGATPSGLARQIVIECIVIAIVGGVAGAGFGFLALRWIRSLIPVSALPPAADISVGPAGMVFALLAATAAGLLFGGVAAGRVRRTDSGAALNAGRHGTTPVSTDRHVRRALVMAQIAVAFVLLVGSGLLFRSVTRLQHLDPGFTAANALTMALPMTPEQRPDPEHLNTYLESIRAAVAGVPGVGDAAFTSALPLEGPGFGLRYAIEGHAAADGPQRAVAFLKMVSPTYFEVLGIRRISGRSLADSDRSGTPPVAVINDALAAREFGTDNPIGQRIVMRRVVPGRTQLGDERSWEIVGVVASEAISGLDDRHRPGIYVSHYQSPTYNVQLVARTDAEPASLQRAVRTAIDRVSASQAVSDMRTLDDLVSASMFGNLVVSRLVAAFAVIAALLAAAGISGVVSYAARQRARELGIRATLGADARALRRLLVRESLQTAALGLACGAVGVTITTPVLASMLYGVGTYDPTTMIAAAISLLTVAGLAAYVPARRLTNVDPMIVLRT